MSEETTGGHEEDGSATVFRFPPYEFDVGAGLLRRGDEETPLPPKAARVLSLLLSRSGQLVTKEELLESVWEGASVTEFSLTSAIKLLRKALGDDARDPEYIQTLHRRGYRFVGSVQALRESRSLSGSEFSSSEASGSAASGSEASGSAAPTTASADPATTPDANVDGAGAHSVWRSLIPAGVVALAAIIIAIAANVTRPPTEEGSRRGSEAPATTSDEPESAFGLVVLPVPEIGETVQQRRFAAGIGDELSTMLAEVMGPGVVPWSVTANYDRSNKTLPQIADHFGARFVLALSVRWATGGTESYQLGANLLRAADGALLWEGSFPGELNLQRMFEQQAEIANGVIESLAVTIPVGKQQVVAAWPTGDLRAWEEYLQGMEKMQASIYDDSGWDEAAVHFETAIEHDKDYAVARAMLARTYSTLLGTERLRKAQALVTELERDYPTLPQTQWALGAYYYNITRVPAAAPEPIDPEQPSLLPYYERALQHLEEARRGLPYDLDLEGTLATVNRRLGNWSAVLAGLQRLHQIQPQHDSFTTELMLGYALTRNHEQADRLLDEMLAKAPARSALVAMKAFNHLSWGRPISELREDLISASAELPPEPTGSNGRCQSLLAWILADAAEGNFQDLVDRRARAPECQLGTVGNMRFSFDLYAAYAFRELGLTGAADRALEAAIASAEAAYSSAPLRKFRYQHNAERGLAYAVAGHRDEALQFAARAVELLPIEQDAFQGIEPYYFYVRTLAQLGDIDEALEELTYLLSLPGSWMTPALARADPFLEPVVNDPRFEELAEDYPPAADSSGQ